MKPAEAPIPEPTDAHLKRVVALFQAGDFKVARKALAKVEAAGLTEDDQGTYARMQRALEMEPLFVVGLIACAVVWLVLFVKNTG